MQRKEQEGYPERDFGAQILTKHDVSNIFKAITNRIWGKARVIHADSSSNSLNFVVPAPKVLRKAGIDNEVSIELRFIGNFSAMELIFDNPLTYKRYDRLDLRPTLAAHIREFHELAVIHRIINAILHNYGVEL